MSETFTKRSGTTDLGKDYEDCNLANIILKLVTNSAVDSFSISSNDASFGDFDDLVVEAKVSAKIEKYAVQLKHTKNKKSLTLESLKQDKGDFSIDKYFQSFKKIYKSKKSYQYVLFTNRKLEVQNGETVSFDTEGFSVTMKELQPMEILNTGEKGRCFRFENLQFDHHNHLKKEDKLLYQKFFDSFFLYTAQASVQQIEKKTKEQFIKTFSCTENEFSKYLQFIKDWSKREGTKNKLDDKLMKPLIGLYLLSPYIRPLSFDPVNKRMDILQEAIALFDITYISEQSVTKIWTKTKNIKNKIDEINNIRKKFQLNFDYISCVDDLRNEDCTTVLWLMKKCPLIIPENESTLKAVELCAGYKFVLIGKDNGQFKNRSLLRRLSDLKQKEDILKKILTSFKCSLQGKREITLMHLYKMHKEFEDIVTVDDLLEMVDQIYLVGGGKETLPFPYIDRHLTRNFVSMNSLKKLTKDGVVVISALNKLDTVKELSHFNLINVEDFLRSEKSESEVYKTILNPGVSVYFASNVCSREDFKAICERNPDKNSFHHLRITEDGNFECLQIKSSTEQVQKFYFEKIYPENSFYPEDSINNINVLIGEPGLGKSILIKNFINNFISNSFAVILYPKDMRDLCKFLKTSSDIERVEKFILDKIKMERGEFTYKFLKMMFAKRQPVLIWDGIDEISSENLQTISNVICIFSKVNVVQWVTSRIHLKKFLEAKFNVLSRRIEPFTKEEQWFYIRERLLSKYESRNLMNDLEIIRAAFVLVTQHEIFGIPLQTFMLTELLLQNDQLYKDLLNNTLNLTDLFYHFIDEKLKIYYKDKQNLNPDDSDKILKQWKKSALKNHEKAALLLLVPELGQQFSEDCREFFEDIKQNDHSEGIIIEVTDDGFPIFIHNSFAMYFVASYLLRHYTTIANFEAILFKEQHRNIRFFFDLLLAKNSSLHVAVLNHNLSALKEHENELSNSKDLKGRNLLHLACSWGQSYPILNITIDDGIWFINDKNYENIVLPESPQYIEMLNYLLAKCDLSETDLLFNYTSDTYAEKSGNLFARVVLLQRQDKKWPGNDINALGTILYFSVIYGYEKFLAMCENLPLIKNKSDGSSLLHISVVQVRCLEILLKNKSYQDSINEYENDILTALNLACNLGLKKSASLLIQHGADMNLSDKNGHTSLMNASYLGYFKLVQLLLTSGADLHLTDGKGFTAFQIACFAGHTNIVKLFINHEKSVISVVVDNKMSRSPLQLACEFGFVKVAEVLLDQGADINYSDKDGSTALHMASGSNQYDCTELLIKRGAEINVQNGGVTPLYFAAEHGHRKIVQLLLKNGANPLITYNGFTALHIACKQGHTDTVKVLVKYKTNINFRDDTCGFTALNIACYHGHEECAQELLKARAEVDIADNHDFTPLLTACEKGHKNLVELLLRHGADKNACDKNDWTHLHIACVNNRYEIAELLISIIKVDVNARDMNGWTPLHHACWEGHVEIVHLLLNSKAKVNISENDGFTPFHLACQKGHFKIVKLLLERGVNINALGHGGQTALHVALLSGNCEVVHFLVENGADINCVGLDGLTPLEHCNKLKFYDMVILLAAHGAARRMVVYKCCHDLISDSMNVD